MKKFQILSCKKQNIELDFICSCGEHLHLEQERMKHCPKCLELYDCLQVIDKGLNIRYELCYDLDKRQEVKEC